MNRLYGHLSYLCGSIDKSNDYGRGWRNNMTEFLQNYGIGVLNPCDKPFFNAKVDEQEGFVKHIQKLKESGKYAQVTKEMQEIVRLDFKMVDLCNFMILNIDSDVHMCGSYAEQTLACYQRKPIIVHCSNGIDKIPNWIWGVCDYKMFFDTWEGVKEYIEYIAFDEDVPDDIDSKWRFLDYNKIFGREIVSIGMTE